MKLRIGALIVFCLVSLIFSNNEVVAQGSGDQEYYWISDESYLVELKTSDKYRAHGDSSKYIVKERNMRIVGLNIVDVVIKYLGLKPGGSQAKAAAESTEASRRANIIYYNETLDISLPRSSDYIGQNGVMQLFNFFAINFGVFIITIALLKGITSIILYAKIGNSYGIYNSTRVIIISFASIAIINMSDNITDTVFTAVETISKEICQYARYECKIGPLIETMINVIDPHEPRAWLILTGVMNAPIRYSLAIAYLIRTVFGYSLIILAPLFLAFIALDNKGVSIVAIWVRSLFIFIATMLAVALFNTVYSHLAYNTVVSMFGDPLNPSPGVAFGAVSFRRAIFLGTAFSFALFNAYLHVNMAVLMFKPGVSDVVNQALGKVSAAVNEIGFSLSTRLATGAPAMANAMGGYLTPDTIHNKDVILDGHARLKNGAQHDMNSKDKEDKAMPSSVIANSIVNNVAMVNMDDDKHTHISGRDSLMWHDDSQELIDVALRMKHALESAKDHQRQMAGIYYLSYMRLYALRRAEIYQETIDSSTDSPNTSNGSANSSPSSEETIDSSTDSPNTSNGSANSSPSSRQNARHRHKSIAAQINIIINISGEIDRSNGKSQKADKNHAFDGDGMKMAKMDVSGDEDVYKDKMDFTYMKILEHIQPCFSALPRDKKLFDALSIAVFNRMNILGSHDMNKEYEKIIALSSLVNNYRVMVECDHPRMFPDTLAPVVEQLKMTLSAMYGEKAVNHLEEKIIYVAYLGDVINASPHEVNPGFVIKMIEKIFMSQTPIFGYLTQSDLTQTPREYNFKPSGANVYAQEKGLASKNANVFDNFAKNNNPGGVDGPPVKDNMSAFLEYFTDLYDSSKEYSNRIGLTALNNLYDQSDNTREIGALSVAYVAHQLNANPLTLTYALNELSVLDEDDQDALANFIGRLIDKLRKKKVRQEEEFANREDFGEHHHDQRIIELDESYQYIVESVLGDFISNYENLDDEMQGDLENIIDGWVEFINNVAKEELPADEE